MPNNHTLHYRTTSTNCTASFLLRASRNSLLVMCTPTRHGARVFAIFCCTHMLCLLYPLNCVLVCTFNSSLIGIIRVQVPTQTHDRLHMQLTHPGLGDAHHFADLLHCQLLFVV